MKPLTAASPHAIIMIGIPGSGKSTFAERFANTFQAPIVSQTKLQYEYGLTLEQAEALRMSILTEFMKTHRTVLIDGGLDRRDKREEMVRTLVKAGYRPLIVWVQTDTNEAYRRAAKPYPAGSGLRSDEFDILLSQFDAPGEKEKMVVISGKHTYTSQLKIILKQLATPDTTQPKVPPSPKDKAAAAKITVRTQSRNRGTLLR
jgi:predicted kinase